MKSLKRPLAALTLVGGLGGAAGLVAQNTNKPSVPQNSPSGITLTPEKYSSDPQPKSRQKEAVPDDTFADAHEVIDITNAERETSRIAILYVEKVKSLSKAPITENNSKSIIAGVAKSLERKGFNSEAATSIAYNFASNYKSEYAQKKFNAQFPVGEAQKLSPSARSMDENGLGLNWSRKRKDQSRDFGEVAPTCVINDLTTSFNGTQWIKSFINLGSSPHAIAIREDYKKEFHSFVRDHEIAHCMGADEPRADYVAAKFMLRDHPDKARATRFLGLFAKMRIIHTLWTRRNSGYEACDMTITKAIQESKSGKKLTNEQIWSFAKDTSVVDPQMNQWAAELIKKSNEPLVKEWADNYEFAQMSGSFKIEAYDNQRRNPVKYKAAMKYAAAFDTFAAIFKAREEAIQDERDEEMVRKIERETGTKFPRQSPR